MKAKSTSLRTLLVLLLTTLLGTTRMQAQNEMYAVYTSNNTTLTFYYDGSRSTRTGTSYDLPTGSSTQPAWYTDGTCANVTRVVFGPTFANAKPTSTSYWFYHMSKLATIENWGNLNTIDVTSMNQMFAYCSALTSLNLSYFNTSKVTTMRSMFWECTGLTNIFLGSFNTEKVTNMYGMFKGCSALTTLDIRSFKTTSLLTEIQEMFYQCYNLTTIYAGPGWNYTGSDSQVFNGSTKLVGGEGTKYNSSHLDATYARVDAAGTPGYFTRVPYAAYNSADNSLTFYDNDWNTHTGDNITIYPLNTGNISPAWVADGTNVNVTKVVFDASFANARPTTTYGWFSSMRSLKTIENLSLLNTSEVTSMAYMFYYCTSLPNSSFDLSTFDTSKVTTMTCMFEGCHISNLDLSTFDTSKVTNMYCMFRNSDTRGLNLSGWDTSNVTNMNNMFEICTLMTTLDLSSFNTSNLKSTYHMFYDCTNLETIYVGKGWDMSANTYSTGMFIDCSKIKGGKGTAYDSSNTDKAYAHVDGGASNKGYLTAKAEPYVVYNSGTLTFYVDDEWFTRTGTKYFLNEGSNAPAWFSDTETRSNVTTVVFDASFADARPTSTNQWFSNMGNLTTINGIEYLNTSSVTNMGEMFVLCEKLTSIDLSHFDTHNVTDMGYMFHSCSALTILDLSSFDTHLVTSTNYMFYNCSALTTIYASDDWDVSHITSSWSVSMFQGCTNLKGGNGTPYDAGHIDKSYAIIDGTNGLLGYLSYKPYVVYNSSNNTLTFRCDGNQRNHTSENEIVYALNLGANYPSWLDYSSDIQKVVFDGSFVLARPTTTYRWFYGMSNLTNIIGIENLYTFEVTNMAAMFLSCSKLEELDVSHFDTQKVTTMSAMFYGCSKLTSLDLRGFDTSNVTNMSSMFQFCDLLKSLDLRGWNTANVTTTSQQFLRCGSLTTLDLSSFDTHEVTSMSYMFQDCSNLTTIYVGSNWNTDKYTSPNGVTSLFKNCTSLVGMKGTICDGENNISKKYARVDGGPDSDTPGYLSDKPYVVYDSSTTTLTFYCDGLSSTHMADETETVYDLNKGDEQTAWYLDGKDSSVQTVIFDPSFANARPTSTKDWFATMFNLTNIEGMQYLNTSEVTNMMSMFSLCRKLESVDVTGFDTRKVTTMNSMFNECNALEILDLSSFNTSLVTDMNNMFSNCTSLTTIYVKSNWNEGFEGNSSFMFTNCAKLIGGAGTEWDSSLPVDISYAQIDGGEMDPGYFTATPAYAILSEDGKTLTFYYDGNPTDKTGKKYYLNSEAESPGWVQDNSNKNIEKVVFDSSFADARPTSTCLWFTQMEALTKIEDIEYLNTSDVRSMRSMFYGCSNMTTLDVSHFVTDNVTDMRLMFYECSNLTTLDVSGFDTQNVTDMAGMFSGCACLTTLDVSGFNTQNVVYMNWMFQNCTHLTTLDVSGFNTQNVIDMKWMFTNCQSLESLDVSGFNTQNVTGMSYMFQNCNSLTSLDVSNFQTDNVTSMVSMFAGCKELTSLDVSGFNTENVVRSGMVYMFSNCEKLTMLDVSNFNTGNVEYFDEMFYKCKALTMLDLSNFNTSKAVSLYDMFGGCTALKKLDLSNFNTSKVDDMRMMFNGCTALTTIYVANDWNTETAANETDNSGSSDMFKDCISLVGGAGTSWNSTNPTDRTYAHIDGGSTNPGYFSQRQLEPYVVYNSDNTTLTFYCDLLRDTHTAATETVYDLNEGSNDPAWYKYDGTGTNSSVTTVVFAPSFTNARPTSTRAWFMRMNNLTEIEGLEYLNTSEVTDMNAMFAETQLTTLDLCHFDMSKVTNISYMFKDCSSLKTIYVSSAWSNWNNGTISGSPFSGCNSLVGGAGTEYASGNIGISYAHVDGGTSNPGYFTLKTDFLLGDVNHDGSVNVADVTALVNLLNAGNVEYNEVADVDSDGSVTNTDVKALVYNILGSYALMYVEDVFSITGRGTVATGQILKGMFRTGQTAVLRSISDAIADVEFTISGIEKFQQTVDVAVAGDNVGILVPVDKANVQRGDVLTIKNNPELRHSKTVKGTLYVLTKEEGGRHTPFSTGYRPQMYVAGADFTVECSDMGMVNGSTPEMIKPGDTSVNIVFEVVEDGKTPYVYPGQVVLLREGGRTIGRLTITGD